VNPPIEIGEVKPVFGLALLPDSPLQRLVRIHGIECVRTAGQLRLDARHRRLIAGELLLQLLEVGIGEGGIQRGEHLAHPDYVPRLHMNLPHDARIEGRHIQWPARGYDAAGAGHDLLELHDRGKTKRK